MRSSHAGVPKHLQRRARGTSLVGGSDDCGSLSARRRAAVALKTAEKTEHSCCNLYMKVTIKKEARVVATWVVRRRGP